MCADLPNYVEFILKPMLSVCTHWEPNLTMMRQMFGRE